MPKITVDYCSKYSSYNGTPVTEGKVLAPVMISDEEFKSNDSIIPENLEALRCSVQSRVHGGGRSRFQQDALPLLLRHQRLF